MYSLHVPVEVSLPGRLLMYPPSSNKCPLSGSQSGGRYPDKDILARTYRHRLPAEGITQGLSTAHLLLIPVNLSDPHGRRSPAIQNEKAGGLAQRLF